VHRQSDRGHKSRDAIVSLLADLQDQRHHRLSKHSRRVAALAASITKTLELPQSEVIRHAALLHDLGLVGVSDRVLGNSNPELLRGDDGIEYRSHPVRGQETVDAFDELQGIGRLIRHHHEEFDGSGFPDGLAGEDIPLGSRIIRLASFIDNNYALSSGKEAKYQVSKKVAAGMGSLFDPALATAANLALKEVLAG
jgi:putative nucleotidyltransferase with HDIG domain